jgi:hypothetical protein
MIDRGLGPSRGYREDFVFVFGFFSGSLFIHVGTYCFKRHCPHSADIISRVPEIRFPIELDDMVSKIIPRHLGSAHFRLFILNYEVRIKVLNQSRHARPMRSQQMPLLQACEEIVSRISLQAETWFSYEKGNLQ